MSARELTRLLAGLSPELARAPAPPTPEEKQRGPTMHAQDYPRARPAFVRNRGEARREANDELPGFRMRNRIRK